MAAKRVEVSEKKGTAVAGKVVEVGLEALRESDRDVISLEILLRVAKRVGIKEQSNR